MDSADEINSILATLADAWRRGDGAGFAAAFAEDADFINILGMYTQGRSQIGAWHDQLFRGIYAGTAAVFSLKSFRKLSDDVTHMLVASVLDVPAGPRAGRIETIANGVLVRNAGRLEIAAFHNTRIVPPGG